MSGLIAMTSKNPSENPVALALNHISLVDRLLQEYRDRAILKECFKDEAEKLKNAYMKEKGIRLSDEEALKKATFKQLDLGGFTTRMKNFPSLMMEAGVIPAVTFYLSKVSLPQDRLVQLYRYFNGEEDSVPAPSDCKDALLGEASGKESAGYSLAIAAILSAMHKLVDDVDFNENDFFQSVVNVLRKLLEDTTKRYALEYMLNEYAIEMKKLVEAYSKAKWETEE
jgi:hypothetical protein